MDGGLVLEGLRLCVCVREEKEKRKLSGRGSKLQERELGEELRVGLSTSSVIETRGAQSGRKNINLLCVRNSVTCGMFLWDTNKGRIIFHYL